VGLIIEEVQVGRHRLMPPCFGRLVSRRMSTPIRVVLADDTAEIRMLLRLTLEPDGRFEIVGEASDGLEAIEVVAEAHPDAVILDLAMPVMDGLEAIPKLKECCPKTKIVVLSGFQTSTMSNDAMAAGAHAYVEKGAAFKEIATTLVNVVEAA
jgi:DNA-binding NarL/FixJ family response regulator